MATGKLLVHAQSLLAGLLASSLVTCVMLLAVHLGWLNASREVDLATVVLASLTGVIVIGSFLERRGIRS